MGTTYRVFFVDEDDNIISVPVAKFERLQNRDGNTKFPDFRNQKLRLLLVFLEVENREPIEITKIDYSYVSFNHEGKLNEEERREELKRTMDLLCFEIDDLPKNVIDARTKFAEKTYRHKNTWEPSSDIINKVVETVFGKA